MSKFKMTDNKKVIAGYKVIQIEALKDIPAIGVKKGDLGGWLEHPHFLSQHGNCWVGEHAFVFNHSKVAGDVLVSGHSKVFNECELQGNGKVINSMLTMTTASGEFLYQDSQLNNVYLPNQAEVRHSILKNIETREHVKRFICLHSTLEFLSNGELLKGSYSFENTTIKSSHSMFSGRLNLKEVDFDVANSECHIYGDSSLTYVKAVNEPTIYVEASTIKGESKENPVEMKGRVFDIDQSIIEGHTRLIGEIRIVSSQINGDVEIHVEKDSQLEIQRSKISDMVFVGVESERNAKLEDAVIFGDGRYEL